MNYAPYYEPNTIKPLLQNQMVEAKGKKFRVDRWFKGNGHCYEFIDVSEEQVKPFCKKPSEVKMLIESKVIKVIS